MLVKKINLSVFFSVLIAWAIFSSCGVLTKKSDDGDKGGNTFGGKIPSDWNGEEDWSGSSWKVIDR